jgi:cytochrome c nitrite reductase small subunit
VTRGLVAFALAVTPSSAFAAGIEGVPRPKGWIGTTDQWTQGLGIALALLNLIVLIVAWRRLKQAQTTRGVVGTLFFGLAVLPLIVIFFGYTQGMSGMETVQACGGCHPMTGHILDLQNPASESLAAVRFKNRYIRENQCYTCHSDYGMFGTISAKMDGVGHVLHYLRGSYPVPIKIRQPYANTRCFNCHAGSQKFTKSPGHPAEIQPQLLSGETPCLTCHAPAHTPAEAKQ